MEPIEPGDPSEEQRIRDIVQHVAKGPLAIEGIVGHMGMTLPASLDWERVQGKSFSAGMFGRELERLGEPSSGASFPIRQRDVC